MNNLIKLLILLITLMLLGCFGGDEDEKKSKESIRSESTQEEINKKVAKQALDELEEEYNEEFELESINYIGENDSYIMFVHPKAEPDISFRVIKWAMGGRVNIDNYTDVRRSKQTQKLFKPFADAINESNYFYAGTAGATHSELSIGQEKPYWLLEEYSIEDILEMYRGHTSIYFEVDYFFDITDRNKRQIYQTIYDMILYLEELGVLEVDIRIDFYDEEYFKDVDMQRMLVDGFSNNTIKFDSAFSYDYSMSIIYLNDYLVEDLIKEIESPKDVSKILRHKVWTEYTERPGDRWIYVYDNEYTEEHKELLKRRFKKRGDYGWIKEKYLIKEED